MGIMMVGGTLCNRFFARFADDVDDGVEGCHGNQWFPKWPIGRPRVGDEREMEDVDVMAVSDEDYRDALSRAHEHTLRWLASVETRSVGPSATANELRSVFAVRSRATGPHPRP